MAQIKELKGVLKTTDKGVGDLDIIKDSFGSLAEACDIRFDTVTDIDNMQVTGLQVVSNIKKMIKRFEGQGVGYSISAQ